LRPISEDENNDCGNLINGEDIQLEGQRKFSFRDSLDEVTSDPHGVRAKEVNFGIPLCGVSAFV